MNQRVEKVSFTSGGEVGRLWRPWISAEDAEMLRQLPPVMAREMDRLLIQQARADARFRRLHSSIPEDLLEEIAAKSKARSWCGAGGGINRGRIQAAS